MTSEDFNQILNETIEKATSILGSKAQEYAKGDRLHNFKVAAKLSNSTPEMALRGMVAKHIISLWDLIQDAEDGKYPTMQLWDEKIIDIINYMFLLRALVVDQMLKD
jgi:hypothetical protein